MLFGLNRLQANFRPKAAQAGVFLPAPVPKETQPVVEPPVVQAPAVPSNKLQRFEFKPRGTGFAITLYAPDEDAANTASNNAFARIIDLERRLSDTEPESEVAKLCEQPFGQPVTVSDELFEILQKAQRAAELSDGAFDVTVGPVVRLWRRARNAEVLPPSKELAHARESVDWRKVKLNTRGKTVTLTAPDMQLNLGGIGKGYIADKALEVLQDLGISRALLVAASGDMVAGEAPPEAAGWLVKVGDSDGKNPRLARTILLRNAAVSTSSAGKQFVEIEGKRYSRIVDPRTGKALVERLDVCVIAPHAAEADSFDTAVNVLGVEDGLKLIESQSGTAALIVRKNDSQAEVFESRRFKRFIVAE